MGKFSKYSKFIKLPPNFKLARIEEDFEYRASNGDTVEVLAGFVSDGASIPQLAKSIIGGPFEEYAYAAFVHDWCYKFKLFSRKRCDEIFEEAMRDLGVSFWKRKSMYWAVRSFAWLGWNAHRKREPKESEVIKNG